MKKYLTIVFLFVSVIASAQSWLWGRQGSSGLDTYPLAVDNNGNVYISGGFPSYVQFGSFTLSDPYWQSFIVKYNRNGNVLWAKQSKSVLHGGTVDGNNSPSIATDNSGHEYLYGTIQWNSNVSFGTDTITDTIGGSQVFLVKYDSNGNVLWAKQSGVPVSGNSTAQSSSVICDKKGNIYITGYFIDTISFGGFTLAGPSFGSFFIVKYNSMGKVVWVRQAIGSSNPALGYGFFSQTTDQDCNIYVTGGFEDTITFGANTLKTDSMIQGFLVKYDSNGNVLWAQQTNNASVNGKANSISVIADPNGNAYITGYFEDTISLGKIMLRTNSYWEYGDIFLAKYSNSGNIIWAQQSHHTDTNGWSGFSVALDNHNHLYFSGGTLAYEQGHIVYGKDTFNYANNIDPSLILELDTSGNTICSSIIRTGGDDNNAIASDTSGKYVYLCGDLMVYLVIGEDSLYNSTGDEDPFVARWQPCSSEEGINEIPAENEQVKVYPNPSNGVFYIEQSAEKQSEVIEVYNVLGKEMMNETLRQAQGDNTIDLSDQPSGIYFYRIVSEKGDAIGSGKLIKQ